LKKFIIFAAAAANFLFAEAKSVVVLDVLWPVPSMMSYYLGDEVEFKYIPTPAYNAMANSLSAKYHPNHLKTEHGNSDNFEEITAFGADIYFCHVKQELCNQLENAGLSVVRLSTNSGNSNQHVVLEEWLNSFAQYFDVKEKNEQFLADLNAVENEIAQRTKDVKKPKIAILKRIFPDDKFTIANFGKYLIEFGGAESAFDYGALSSQKINMEELFSVDPEIIFISNFTPEMPEDLYNEPKYASLQAVKNKKVFKFPLASYRPQAPSIDLPVLLKFIAKISNPEIFADVDIKDEFKKHWKKFLNIDLSDEDLELIMNPKREVGKLD